MFFSFFPTHLFYLFILGCTGSPLLCTGPLQLQRAEATLLCGVQAPHHGGLSCCGARALGAWAPAAIAHRPSSCGSRAPERRLSSCGAQAQLLRGMWDPPRPELEPVPPALAGGLPTTVPPGKPLFFSFELRLTWLNRLFSEQQNKASNSTTAVIYNLGF